MIYTPLKIGKMMMKEKWQDARHIEILNDLLIKLAKRELFRLIINMPPRYGKSLLTSILFPFWYIGNFPNHNLMLVTYQNNLARSWGKRILQLISTLGEDLFNIKTDAKERSAGMIGIERYGGKIICVGAGGLLTGLGADAIIVDDPIKNQKEALSLNQRNSLWDWFKATLFTRLEPQGILLMVGTRWHDDDIFGRLVATNPTIQISRELIENFKPSNTTDVWHLLKLPALAKENDPLGRAIGEPLWKERFNLASILEQKKILGDFWFSALYQQEPIFSTGRIFKKENFRYFSLLNDTIVIKTVSDKIVRNDYLSIRECSLFATIDLAIKSTERSDFTVAMVFAVSPKKDVFILEVVREKFDTTDHLNLIQSVFSRWKPVLIGIESVQYQMTLVQSARKLGLPVKELKADKDKIARSLGIANWIDAGKVFFRLGTSWLEEFERELLQFPDGNHDDQVDALAYVSQMIEPMTRSKVWGISKQQTNELLSLFD
ncbi:hypothetical protein D9V84_03815 [Bacteroidetes/Chlorobi group bacterium Naka2016]|jgi:predicted phage terminase large subunit-like protein|nr:MAG: hypothetical protein D9V84_03815 [Bacteroidetes/Chlorobi group bacterium Naka2016]